MAILAADNYAQVFSLVDPNETHVLFLGPVVADHMCSGANKENSPAWGGTLYFRVGLFLIFVLNAYCLHLSASGYTYWQIL